MQRDDKFSFYNWIPYVLKLINQGAVPRQEAGGYPPAQGRHCVGTDRLCLQEPSSELTLRFGPVAVGWEGWLPSTWPGGITCPSIHTQTDIVHTLLSVKACLEHNASPSSPDLCLLGSAAPWLISLRERQGWVPVCGHRHSLITGTCVITSWWCYLHSAWQRLSGASQEAKFSFPLQKPQTLWGWCQCTKSQHVTEFEN